MKNIVEEFYRENVANSILQEIQGVAPIEDRSTKT